MTGEGVKMQQKKYVAVPEHYCDGIKVPELTFQALQSRLRELSSLSSGLSIDIQFVIDTMENYENLISYLESINKHLTNRINQYKIQLKKRSIK